MLSLFHIFTSQSKSVQGPVKSPVQSPVQSPVPLFHLALGFMFTLHGIEFTLACERTTHLQVLHCKTVVFWERDQHLVICAVV